MDLEVIMLSEIRQRKTNAICYHLYVKSEKIKKQKTKEKTPNNMNVHKIQINNHRYRKQTNGYQWGERGGSSRIRALDSGIQTTIYKIDEQQ